MLGALMLQYPKAARKKLDSYLDEVIDRRLQNMTVDLINNYRGKIVHTDFLSLIDHIEKNQLIIGGGATLFVPHTTKDNPAIHYLMDNIAQRKVIKRRLKSLEYGSTLYRVTDNLQINKKLKNNTYYGAQGNKFFRFNNIYIAEAITNCGRNIISSAAAGFEAFLGDNIFFNEIDEVYTYISNIAMDYVNEYSGIDLATFLNGIPTITNEMLVKRILDKCKFNMDDKIKERLSDLIIELDPQIKILLWYKNNLFEFLRIPVIKDKIAYLFQTVDVLTAPDINNISTEEGKGIIKDLWSCISMYVFNNHPIYDRIRKTRYTSKKAVYYIDTDSVFLALNPFVQFVKNEVIDNNFNYMNETDVEFTACNLLTIFLNDVVKGNLYGMGRGMKVPEEYIPKLDMKNELYLRRIVFTDKKKRYLALKMLREGALLNDGLGTTEIKGFDFKKSVTKESVRDFYVNLCLEELLRSDEINLRNIFRKMKAFEAEMRRSLEALEPTYYRQVSVQLPDHYKAPYSNSGYKALVLWNTLCPKYAMQPPVNADIIPIKDLRSPKMQELIKTKYPDVYRQLESKILNNRNPDIAGMGLNYITVPRGTEYEVPVWLHDVLDIDSIIEGNVKLFTSISKSIGINTLVKGSTGRVHLSNIIAL